MDNPKADKWNSLFEGGAKYREINEVFALDLLDALKKEVGKRPAAVVDLGCGSGDTLARFAALGLQAVGVDISNVAIEQAKEKLSAATLIQHDLDDIGTIKIDAPVGTLWICKLVLAFVTDKKAFLNGVRGLMRDGDALLVMTPVLREDVAYAKEDKPGIALPVTEAEGLMMETFGGFTVFASEYPAERGHVVSYLVKK
jgi:ubiquinone/menaquinone biosynthesis C-methylase UbiE